MSAEYLDIKAWEPTIGIDWDRDTGPVRPPHGFGTVEPRAAQDIRSALDLAAACLRHATHLDALDILEDEAYRLDRAYPDGWAQWIEAS